LDGLCEGGWREAALPPSTHSITTFKPARSAQPKKAEAQRAKLALQGLDARVSEREQSGRTVFRVRIGPMESREDAERVQQKLAASKIDAALVRVQR